MRILFVTPVLEHPPAGGPQLRIENSIKALSRVAEIDIIFHNETGYDKTSEMHEYFRKFAHEYHVFTPSMGRSSLLDHFVPKYFKGKLKRFVDLDARRKLSEKSGFIADFIQVNQVKIVWFGYGNVSYQLIRSIKELCPNVRVVCDTDSVWSRFILRELPYVSWLRKMQIWIKGHHKEIEEQRSVQLCDVTTAVSTVDASYYKGIAKIPEKIHVFSNAIDLDIYQNPPPPPRMFHTPAIFLAGTFWRGSPMERAAIWIIDAVLPIVRRSIPNVHLYIAGRDSDTCLRHFGSDNITITGRVKSVLPYLCNSDVAIVPLMFESGTRFKILEAGACKIPIVSTTLGAEGIPVIDGMHVVIADRPESFAEAIVKVIVDKVFSQSIAANCYLLVKEGNSIDALASEAVAIINYLNESNGSFNITD